MLDGTWKLVYTSNSQLSGVLALARLPFVAVGDYTQTIGGGIVENKVPSPPCSNCKFTYPASPQASQVP